MLLDDAVRALREDNFASWYEGLADAQQEQFQSELKEVFVLAVEMVKHVANDVPTLVQQGLEMVNDILASRLLPKQ